jgi:hypothetical protein
MITREEFERAWVQIPGLDTQRHALIVEGMIRWLRPDVVLEIGCFKGCITARAARALQENGSGYLVVVDLFCLEHTPDDLKYSLEMTGTLPVVELIAGDSVTVPFPDHVDMALIDGDHGVEECWLDVRRSIDAGAKCICLHDTWPFVERPASSPGPSLALARLNAMGWSTICSHFDRGYGVALRP